MEIFESKDRPTFEVILDNLERNLYNLIPLKVETYVKQRKTKIPQDSNKPKKITSLLPSIR